MKLTTNIVIAVSGLSLLLLSNHGADASTLRKPRRATEDIKKISENINTKQSAKVSLKKHKAETTKNNLTAFIESKECDAFTESLSDKAAGFILNFDDSTIIEYACNAINRKQIAQFGEQIADRDIARHKKGSLTCESAYEMKLSEAISNMIEAVRDIARHKKGSLTCESAYEMKLSEAISNMIERTSSYDACEEEMKSELQYVQRAASRGELKKVMSDLVVVDPESIIIIIIIIIILILISTTPAY
eukprot:CAMPEP_0194127284 /NCGR_PEP_ID=MMETSP0150-20130528/60440_1 /TAXON_ID=122233 /ORGANISM="Chaetoceros debilis, Strain MM31A-1" /LENGTH=246 /DNA_ID=CAMNT_0038821203 /DNA_START=175 /DNA_END=916 /DNA_ORIENTATION=-